MGSAVMVKYFVIDHQVTSMGLKFLWLYSNVLHLAGKKVQLGEPRLFAHLFELAK